MSTCCQSLHIFLMTSLEKDDIILERDKTERHFKGGAGAAPESRTEEQKKTTKAG